MQEEDAHAQKIRAEKLGQEGWEDSDGILDLKSRGLRNSLPENTTRRYSAAMSRAKGLFDGFGGGICLHLRIGNGTILDFCPCRLVKVILGVVLHYTFLYSNVSDRCSVFTSKFWSSWCYLLGIKRKLSIAFTLNQRQDQETGLGSLPCALVNFEQNDWARFLTMAKVSPTPFASNGADNVKNPLSGLILLKLVLFYPIFSPLEFSGFNEA